MADLSEETLLQWIRRAKDTIISIYEIAYERSHDKNKLIYALRRIIPKLSTDLLDDNSAEDKTERRAEVVEQLELEFGLNSDSARGQSLQMMCNDFAFEIGLLRNCMELMEHYAKSDALTVEILGGDIQDAGLRVIVATTRDCDDLFLQTSVFHGLKGEMCLVEGSDEIALWLISLFEPYEDVQDSAM